MNWNARNSEGDSALTIALMVNRFAAVQFLYGLSSIKVDVEELKNKDILAQAFDCCRDYVLVRMGREEPITNKTDHILRELMFSLQNGLSASIVHILVSCASTWDI